MALRKNMCFQRNDRNDKSGDVNLCAYRRTSGTEISETDCQVAVFHNHVEFDTNIHMSQTLRQGKINLKHCCDCARGGKEGKKNRKKKHSDELGHLYRVVTTSNGAVGPNRPTKKATTPKVSAC